MIRLDQAFGPGALGGYHDDDRGMSYPAAPAPPRDRTSGR